MRGALGNRGLRRETFKQKGDRIELALDQVDRDDRFDDQRTVHRNEVYEASKGLSRCRAKRQMLSSWTDLANVHLDQAIAEFSEHEHRRNHRGIDLPRMTE